MSRLLEAEAFLHVVDNGSFTSAAKALGLSTSYVSRLVSRLEERLGVRLLTRTTRKVTPTTAGEAYYARCAEIVRRFDDADDMARELGETLRGTLRVTAPTAWAGLLADALSGFRERHGQLSVELTLLDRQTSLAEEGFDLALRAGELVDDTLIARKLSETERVVLASPAHLARHGVPVVPEDLAAHECVRYAYHREPNVWRLSGPSGSVEVAVGGRVLCNHGGFLVDAAVRGQGLVLVPVMLARDALESGRVVRVLPEWRAPLTLYAVFPPGPRVPRRVRAFVDFLVDHLRDTRASSPQSLSSP